LVVEDREYLGQTRTGMSRSMGQLVLFIVMHTPWLYADVRDRNGGSLVGEPNYCGFGTGDWRRPADDLADRFQRHWGDRWWNGECYVKDRILS